MKREELEQKQYREAADRIHAPQALADRVLRMERAGTAKRRRLRPLACAAAALALVLVSSNVIAYASSGSTWIASLLPRMVFFYGSREEAAQAKEEAGVEQYASSYDLTIGYTEEAAVDTGYLLDEADDEAYNFFFSIGYKETLVSDEAGGPSDPWTRKVVKSNPLPGGERFRLTESYAGEDAADLLSLLPQYEGWDLSWLGETYTPVPRRQLLRVKHFSDCDSILCSYLSGRYRREADDAEIQIWCSYESGSEFPEDFVPTEELDFYEYYTTADGVELPIMGRGSQIVAELSSGAFGLQIHTENLSQEEVEEIADHLNLAALASIYAEQNAGENGG